VGQHRLKAAQCARLFYFPGGANKQLDFSVHFGKRVPMRQILLLGFFTLTLWACERHRDYRNAWVGEFEGDITHGTSYPSTDSNGNWIILTQTMLSHWQLVVEKDGDSALSLTKYVDGNTHILGSFPVKPTGQYLMQSGGGSSYHSLEIWFASDTVTWNDFQKCGIPCSSWTTGTLVRL
jgi:hypothetical protein